MRGSGKLEVGSEKQEAKIVGSGKWEVKSKKLRPKALPTLHFPLSTFHSPLRVEKPQDIKLCDPAAGSGHMLTYAFDLLYLIYEEEGYAPSEIPALILRHNLHGLEICPRAAQLAELALVFKAREKARRFFQPEHFVRPNIIELQDLRFDDGELSAYFTALGVSGEWEVGSGKSEVESGKWRVGSGEWEVGSGKWKVGSGKVREETADESSLFSNTLSASSPTSHSPLATPHFRRLLQQFEESKNFGSLIQPCLTEAEIQSARSELSTLHSSLPTADLMVGASHLKVLRVLDQAEALTQRYHVVVANPPYMGGKTMNSQLREFAKELYADGRVDLFAMFIERGFSLVQAGGYNAMVTMQAWMFLSSFEDLRAKLLSNWSISSMAHLGPRAFDTIGGEVVQTTAFVAQNEARPNHRAIYLRLTDGRNEKDKSDKFLSALANPVGGLFFRASTADFRKVPGSPIAYWLSKGLQNCFQRDSISTSLLSEGAVKTGDNAKFLRYLWEVSSRAIGATSAWRKHPKGGGFRKWYGNLEFVVKWSNDARMHYREDFIARIPIKEIWDIEGVTWTAISSANLSFRLKSSDEIPNNAALFVYPAKSTELVPFLCCLNSTVTKHFLEILSPTLNFLVGDVLSIPHPQSDKQFASVSLIGSEMIGIARTDWDNFETSWDFRDFPLLRGGTLEVGSGKQEAKTAGTSHSLKGLTLAESWANWNAYCTAAIRRMQELETENNRLFIAAYGLEGELQPEVPEEQITLARADARKDMAAFLSYAVGCMMGRYSLHAPGLILANAGDTLEDYVRIVAAKKVESEKCKVESEEGKKVGCGKLEVESGKQDVEPEGTSHSQLSTSHSQLPTSHSPLPTSHSPLPTAFHPDADGILPVLDGEWFEDDIVARTREFLRATFGEATLKENLRFIEDSLGKDLRKYFLTDFYKDHLQTYKKRPIYWLVQSPKKGFSVLVYLHRYTRDTFNLVLNSYLRDYQVMLRNRLSHLAQAQVSAASARDKTEARKEFDKLTKTLHECEEWERQTLLPLAQARIELDLDDGVKVNYL